MVSFMHVGRSFRSIGRLPKSRTFLRSVAGTSIPDKYDHATIDKKWQKSWDDQDMYAAKRREGHKKKYVLDMFPYPSGAGLHVGHPEGYTATDIMARYWRSNDFDVLHPMGWDAFGLPAEQHAINTGTHPAVTTYENIATFKRQLKSLGFSYDWNRELSTTDDGYVKWTQWVFLQLFKAGLAGQSEVSVNWCPALGTVLANEEIIDGLSERGNHPVVRMPLRQWVFKITEYADKLEEDLEGLDWPEGTKTAQRAWIGKSVGGSIAFKIDGYSDESIEVFTTRPDTLLGVTYVVLAPEHTLVDKITTAACKKKVEKYVARVAGKSDLERTSTGVDKGKTGEHTGAYAIHPLTGEKVPILVADYVLAGYGTGAVMAVPAHDERDFEFAQVFDLPVKRVVEGGDLPFCEYGVACDSGQFDGMDTESCKAAVLKVLSSLGCGGPQITYKLRDWVFSRQRYWGEPIPIYFPVELDNPESDPRKGGSHRILFDEPIPVPEEELPLTLPEMDDFKPGDDPQGCLARAVDWRYFERDGQWFARETNTMPQWAGSCWYYLRFTDTKNSEQIFGPEGASWLPVDLYVGGQEHAVLHLLYARFWHKVLYDLGIVNVKEPFSKLVHQGMILGADGEKMSKSRGNVINPDDVVQEHGADVLRLYEMFMGPLEATKPWQTQQVSGVVRFRDRVYALLQRGVSDATATGEEQRMMHKTIKKVTEDIERLSFNTAISALMVLTNTLAATPADKSPPRDAIEALVVLLNPFTPHLAEEGWSMLGKSESVNKAPWPEYDEKYCEDTVVTVAIQVNGKVRAKMEIEKDTSADDAIATALGMSQVAKWIEDKDIKKSIYVPGRIVNVVVVPKK
jgi:leucyl-tRNA synthetase